MGLKKRRGKTEKISHTTPSIYGISCREVEFVVEDMIIWCLGEERQAS